jgi:hypothetical protein
VPIIDLLLIGPALTVIAVAVAVWHRERPVPDERPEEADVAVDLTFLRSGPQELDRLISELSAEAEGTLGARMRTAQLAAQSSPPPVARARRRRTRPLVASR